MYLDNKQLQLAIQIITNQRHKSIQTNHFGALYTAYTNQTQSNFKSKKYAMSRS